MSPMHRRSFLSVLGGAAAAWPLAARAQQPLPVVGFLHPGTAEATVSTITAFRKGLSETGFIEGRNVVVEYRWANNRYDRLAALVAELLNHKVAVIYAGG